MKRILVTGGCGFIGANFVRLELETYPDVSITNLDALTYAGNPDNLADLSSESRYRFVHGDVADRALVTKLLADGDGFDAVVHFAAESHVDRSIDDATPFLRTNIVGTQCLLDAARAAKTPRYVQVSTDEVYGTLAPEDPPFTESTPLAPNSPYAASKAGADLLVRAAHHTHGMNTVITRCSNNYGPYQFPEKLIPLFITNAFADIALPVYGDGRQVRDWIHVSDHCRGVDAALRHGQAGEVYNFGGRSERFNIDVTHAVLRLTDKPESLIRHVTDRLGHDRRYAVECEKAEARARLEAHGRIRGRTGPHRRLVSRKPEMGRSRPLGGVPRITSIRRMVLVICGFSRRIDSHRRIAQGGAVMRALVTGVTGFVGGHLAEHLLASGDLVVGLSASGRFPAELAHLSGQVRLERFDLAGGDEDALVDLLQRKQPEVIYHLAAQANPQASVADPRGTWALNLGGALNLLEAVRAAGSTLKPAPRVVLVGSGVSYGNPAPEYLPVSESCPLRPNNPYAASKAAADLLGIQHALGHATDVLIVRPFNHAGPRQAPMYVLGALARQVAEVEAGWNGKARVEVGNLDIVRDYTDVRDVVAAYRLLALHGTRGEVYNLGSGRGTRLADALGFLTREARCPIEVFVDPARVRPVDQPLLVADPSKLQAATGWSPRYTIEQTLGDMLAYARTALAADAVRSA